MIEPDAKCVVNGSKLNEAIIGFNPLLAMNVTLGDVVEPSVKYSEGGVQITLPSPFEYANEELDVVNSDNTAGTRWFLTSTSQGGASSSLDSSTTTTSNTPINKSNQSRPKRNRDKLNREGGGQNNRDQLNRAAGGGGSTTASDSRVGVNSAGFDMGGTSGVASDSKSVQNYGRPQPGLFQDSFSRNKMTARRPDAKYAPKKQETMRDRYEQDKGVRRATRYARNDEGRAQAKEDYKKRYSGQPSKAHPGLYGSEHY